MYFLLANDLEETSTSSSNAAFVKYTYLLK